MGNSRGYDGVRWAGGGPPTGIVGGVTQPVPVARGLHDAAPVLELGVVSGALVGLPDDLRGTGGGPGGRVVRSDGAGIHAGGTGGNGGAGLAIICRGMTFGVSGSITLDGNDTTNPAVVDVAATASIYPGAGGPGGPGALLIALDGNSISVPDITGKFFARTGAMTQAGSAMRQPVQRLAPTLQDPGFVSPYCGYLDPQVIVGALDLSDGPPLHYIESDT